MSILDTAPERIQRPTREQVRAWLLQRIANPAPPPDLEQIRRTLGWRVAKEKRE